MIKYLINRKFFSNINYKKIFLIYITFGIIVSYLEKHQTHALTEVVGNEGTCFQSLYWSPN